MNNLALTVGTNVNIIRRLKKITIADLSERSRISPQTLTAIENGKGNPTLVTLHTIARALGVNVPTLFVEQALVQICAEEMEDESTCD